jgi:DNA invertase Pin-like site-specific DNA recombinase
MTTQPKRAAIYARHSTRGQESANEDREQIANCRRLIAKHGWQEVGLYSDPGKSGMIARRPEVQRLLADARAHRIDVIVMDSSSRLHRKLHRQLATLEELKFIGVRVISCDGLIDTDHTNFEIMVAGVGMANQVQVQQTSRHVRETLSHLFKRGRWVGPPVFGYDIVRGETGARLVVNEDEAAIVRRCFETFVAGHTIYAIVKRLRAEGITNKRGREWSYSSLYSDRTRAIGLFGNPIYAGRPSWGRTRQPLDPRTDARVPRLQPPSERLTFHDESLRIVSDDLWRKAQLRLDAIRAETEARRLRLGNGAGPGRRGTFVLSTQLVCGCCKSPFVIVRHDGVYGCSTRRRDKDACRYDRKISRTALEEAIFKAVEDSLFDDAECERVLAAIRERLERRDDEGERQRLRRRLATINREVENVLAEIRRGRASDALRRDLERLEEQKRVVEAELTVPADKGVVVDIERKLAKRRQALAGLRRLAREDVVAARAALRGVLGGPVVLHQSGRGVVVAAIRGRIAGLLDAIGAPALTVQSPRRLNRSQPGIPTVQSPGHS